MNYLKSIVKKEQKEIMAVMEKYRNLIADGRKVSHVEYEKDIYSIFGGYILASRHTPAIGIIFVNTWQKRLWKIDGGKRFFRYYMEILLSMVEK